MTFNLASLNDGIGGGEGSKIELLSLCSAVKSSGWVTGWAIRGLIPGWGKGLFCCPTRPDCLWDLSSLLLLGTGESFREGKAVGILSHSDQLHSGSLIVKFAPVEDGKGRRSLS